jgi:citrate synthase
MTNDERGYCEAYITSLKYQADDYMETVCNESNLSLMQADDVYKFEQLEKSKKFISDFTVALLLKRALICWSENSLPPEDIERYERFEQNFMDNFFWKCVEEKEAMKKMVTTGSGVPSSDSIKDVHDRITKLSADSSLVNETEEEKKKKLIALLKEEFDVMKKKVTHDNFFSVLAERRILGEEIEK